MVHRSTDRSLAPGCGRKRSDPARISEGVFHGTVRPTRPIQPALAAGRGGVTRRTGRSRARVFMAVVTRSKSAKKRSSGGTSGRKSASDPTFRPCSFHEVLWCARIVPAVAQSPSAPTAFPIPLATSSHCSSSWPRPAGGREGLVTRPTRRLRINRKITSRFRS